MIKSTILAATFCCTTVPALAQWPSPLWPSLQSVYGLLYSRPAPTPQYQSPTPQYQTQNHNWYWCDASRTYYPYVATCAVPWRAVNPNGAAPQPYVLAPPSAATAAPFASPPANAQQTPPHALPDQFRALCGEAEAAEEWRRTLVGEPSGACFEKWHANLEPCQDSLTIIGWALEEERKSASLAQAKTFLAQKYREILADDQKFAELYKDNPDMPKRTRTLQPEVIDALAAQVYRELPPSISDENLTKIFTQINDACMSGWRYFSR